MHIQTGFENFDFDSRLIQSLKEARILAPTTLQRAAFPPVLEGRDLVMQAGSGTGRVLAWCLPVIQRLLAAPGTKAIAIVPSGEVALNVEREVKRAGRHVALGLLMPASGVERSGASYAMFGQTGQPDILVGRAPSIEHFVAGTSFPLPALAVLVVDATVPLDPGDREALARLSSRIPRSCQRIVLAQDPSQIEVLLESGLLRSPAILTDTSATSKSRRPETTSAEPEKPAEPEKIDSRSRLRPEPEPEPEPEYRPVQSPRPARPQAPRRDTRRRLAGDRPEHWPVAHVGVVVPGAISLPDLVRVLRVEARGHTVVLVRDEKRARDLVRLLSEAIPGGRVEYMGEDDDVPPDTGDVITVTLGSFRKRESLTGNVLVLDRLPSSADEYVSHIRIMRCDPGDRIVTAVTPKDVPLLYQIRLSYGIRLIERRLPEVSEVDALEQANRLEDMRRIASTASRTDREAYARVRTMDMGEDLLAVAIGRLLDAGGKPEPGGGRARPGRTDSGHGNGSEADRAASGSPERSGEWERAGERDRKRHDKPRDEAGSARADRGAAVRSELAAPEARPAVPAAKPEPPLIKSDPAWQLERGVGRRGGTPMVELELNCGSVQGVDAEFVAQWLQSRLAMGVSDLGPIRVQDHRTVVTVPRDRVEQASLMLGGLSFGDRKVEVRVR